MSLLLFTKMLFFILIHLANWQLNKGQSAVENVLIVDATSSDIKFVINLLLFSIFQAFFHVNENENSKLWKAICKQTAAIVNFSVMESFYQIIKIFNSVSTLHHLSVRDFGFRVKSYWKDMRILSLEFMKGVLSL